MELSFRELQKRDVINVIDGRCLGRIVDIKLCFPKGELLGIVVPGRKVNGLLRFFDRSEIYIEERRIIKIGGDVILVDMKGADDCGHHPHRKERKEPPCCPPESQGRREYDEY